MGFWVEPPSRLKDGRRWKSSLPGNIPMKGKWLFISSLVSLVCTALSLCRDLWWVMSLLRVQGGGDTDGRPSVLIYRCEQSVKPGPLSPGATFQRADGRSAVLCLWLRGWRILETGGDVRSEGLSCGFPTRDQAYFPPSFLSARNNC